MNDDESVATSTVIEQLIQFWRRNIAQDLPTLGIFLDELANSAPLPNLPAHVAVLRKYGVRLIVAVQNVDQFKRSNPDSWEELRKAFPAVLILPNTAEKEMLEIASWMAGEDERLTVSTDHTGHNTSSSERIERVTSAELLPRKPGTGRLLIGNHPGVLVELPDVSATDLLD